MSKRAIILAGGRGTRLLPYTITLPKPLMPIGDYPILEIIVRQLKNNGFAHITMAVNHQAEIIQTFFGDGSKWGLKIDYSLEDKPLSTMGPLKLIDDLPNDFLVMNGDVLTNLNFTKFYQNHVENKNIFTISSFAREIKTEFGVLESDDSTLVGFKEKPVLRYDVSMGIYMASRRVIECIPEKSAYGFDDLMLNLIKNSQKPKLDKFKGYWLDIGRPDDYNEAIKIFEEKQEWFLNE